MKATTRFVIARGLVSLLVSVSVIASAGGAGWPDALLSTAHADPKGEKNKEEKKEKGQTRCSERTVRGTYAFALQGNVGGVGPIAAGGRTIFDGEGLVTITAFIDTTTGAPIIDAALSGTYTVDPEECTGAATFTIPAPGLFGFITELRLDGVIVNKGDEIRYLVTTPGIVLAGSSIRQFSH